MRCFWNVYDLVSSAFNQDRGGEVYSMGYLWTRRGYLMVFCLLRMYFPNDWEVPAQNNGGKNLEREENLSQVNKRPGHGVIVLFSLLYF